MNVNGQVILEIGISGSSLLCSYYHYHYHYHLVSVIKREKGKNPSPLPPYIVTLCDELANSMYWAGTIDNRGIPYSAAPKTQGVFSGLS